MDKTKKIYCGLGEIPKGKRRGTMHECAKLNQIRFWGLKKVDKKVADALIEKKKGKIPTELDLKKKIAVMRLKIKKMKQRLTSESNKDKKEELKKETLKMIETTNNLLDVLQNNYGKK